MVNFTDEDGDLNGSVVDEARKILESGELNFNTLRDNGAYGLAERKIEVDLAKNFDLQNRTAPTNAYGFTFTDTPNEMWIGPAGISHRDKGNIVGTLIHEALHSDKYVDGDGRVELIGFGRNSVISTGHGIDDDVLVAGDGDDFLYGHVGRDILNGGAGDDTMAGGSGMDVFVLNNLSDQDTISDFDTSMDLLYFEGMSEDDLTISFHDEYAHIAYGDDDSVTLNKVTAFNDDNFIFV